MAYLAFPKGNRMHFVLIGRILQKISKSRGMGTVSTWSHVPDLKSECCKVSGISPMVAVLILSKAFVIPPEIVISVACFEG